MSHLERLGRRMEVLIKPDGYGFIGRECPVKECLGYFKIALGTGLKGANLPCTCPYCGHTTRHDRFWTKEQIAYARSVAFNRITEAVIADLRQLEFTHRPRGPFGIGLSMRVEGTPHPIRYYREKRLETELVCENCSLRYAIYGAFGYCPDCRIHNTTNILGKNFDLVGKVLSLAETADTDLATHLIGNALEDAVSAFDGFGRETCRVALVAQSKPVPENLSFQNLAGAQRNVQSLLNYDLASCLSSDEWALACRCFQKRHLLAHKLGVVDKKYIEQAQDPEAVIGRKIRIRTDEVRDLVAILRRLGSSLVQATAPAKP